MKEINSGDGEREDIMPVKMWVSETHMISVELVCILP